MIKDEVILWAVAHLQAWPDHVGPEPIPTPLGSGFYWHLLPPAAGMTREPCLISNNASYVVSRLDWEAARDSLQKKAEEVENSSANEQPSNVMKRGKTERETLELNGWGVGDILEGDEGHGPSRILITAVGETNFLCKWDYDCNGTYKRGESGNTTLSCREWKKVGEAPQKPPTLEWNGEGLPPVGIVCEYTHKNLKTHTYPWQECCVVFVSDQCAVIESVKNHRTQIAFNVMEAGLKFRPKETHGDDTFQFKSWWNLIGSGIAPKQNEDQEQHAMRVAEMAFKAAAGASHVN